MANEDSIEYFNKSRFAKDLINARKIEKLSVEGLASRVGVPRLTIIRYEAQSHIPTPDTFYRICRTLGIDPGRYQLPDVPRLESNVQKEDGVKGPAFNRDYFRNDLRNARKIKGYTLKDVEKKCDIKMAQIGTIERTGKLSTEMFFRLCTMFSLEDKTKYLMAGERRDTYSSQSKVEI